MPRMIQLFFLISYILMTIFVNEFACYRNPWSVAGCIKILKTSHGTSSRITHKLKIIITLIELIFSW